MSPVSYSPSHRQPLQEQKLEHDGVFHANRTVGKHAGQHLGRFPATQRLRLVKDLQLLVVGQRVGLQKTGLQGVVWEVLGDVVHHIHDPGPGSSPAWWPTEYHNGAIEKCWSSPLTCSPERRQSNRLLLLLQAVTMSHQGPPLLQEDKDDHGDDDENGQDNGQAEEIQELHNCLL